MTSRFLLALLIWLSSTPALATVNFTLDGGYPYSRLEYAGASSFTLLSKAGTMGRLEVGIGTGSWEFVTRAQLNQFQWVAPGSRTLNEPDIQTMSYEAGARWKNRFLWMLLGYEHKDTLYLVEQSATEFDVKKEPVSFGVVAMKLFGWGSGYRITLDAEIGLPVSNPSVSEGNFAYGYFSRGFVRVEIGSWIRGGFAIGIENQQYKVSDDDYYRSDFFAGLTIAVDVGKKGSSGGSGYKSPPRYSVF